MDQKSASTQSGGVVFFLVGLLGALGVGWFVFPQLLYSEHQQPVPFSHLAHVESAGMACEDCHFYREDGSYAGYPSTEQCAECHMEPMTENPGEIEFVEEYVNAEREVEWLTYQYQPDNVYFSHIAHDGWDCTECHPDLGMSESAPPVFKNRLTNYTKHTMKMYKCERCHAENGVSNACFVCHK